MTRSTIRIVGISIGLCLIVAVPCGVLQAEEIEGWGTPLDPDGDCAITTAGGKVSIKIPATLHDLWYGQKGEDKQFNAPRVWQQVQGDFVAQVKVTLDLKPGARLPEGTNFLGAGLVVWDSEQQYLRLERSAFVPRAAPDQLVCFTTPLYDRDPMRINTAKTATASDFFKGRSTWLKVERAGQEITTSISHDGKKWTETGVVATEFPPTVQVGIEAINGTARELVVEFEGFKLLK